VSVYALIPGRRPVPVFRCRYVPTLDRVVAEVRS
jgi:hypothetical protein